MKILDDRQKTHGDFGVTARISQALKDALHIGPVTELPPVQRESIEMICVKIARCISGNHWEPDHFKDMAGYATLALRHIEQAKKVPPGSSSIQEPDDEPFDPSVGDNWDYNPRSGHPR